MVRHLIFWSVNNPALVLVLAAILFLFGGITALRMPVDVFPDLTAPTVTILVEGRGMAPKEMETLVTAPIEAAVNGAGSVRRVRSGTAVSIAVIWVEFEWGTDLHRARLTVSERLAAVAGSLPDQVEPPTLAPISSIMGEILFVGLTSDVLEAQELRALANLQVRRRLLTVGGVSQITVLGGDTRQYQVVLSPERLRDFGVTAQAVVDALAEGNENVSSGILVRSGQESLIEGIGRVRTPSDIEDTVVALRAGRPVLVRDLGVVRIGAALRRGTASIGRRDAEGAPTSEPGVILAIQKQTGSNTLDLTRELEATLDEIRPGLPPGTILHRDLLRQADFIEASVSNTTTALLEGAGVVLLIVVAFLASLQASLITLLAIPLSLMAAVLVLRALGAGVDTMTLGGMAIAIGALVDDAIIDVENVVRRLRENARLPEASRRTVRDVVFTASVEVRASIVFATWIILLVFTPLFVLGGVEGRLLQPLGLAFAAGLAGSLLVALTVTPALCGLLLARSRTVASGKASWIVRTLDRLYARPLRGALRRPLLIVGLACALLGLAGWQLTTFGGAFLPEFNEGALVVGLVTAPGTSLEESDRLARFAELALLKHPEVQAVGRRTGRAEEDEHVQGVEASELDITLDMEAAVRAGQPRRSKEELLQALRGELAGIPGVQATFGQPISHRIDHMLSGTRANVAVKLFGPELPELRRLGAALEKLMQGVPGVVDLSLEQQVDVPSVRVEFDREALARLGLTIGDAARALDRAGKGQIATQIFEGTVAYELVVRTGPGADLSQGLAALREAPVDVPNAAPVPLRAVARIYEDMGPNFISRESLQRKIVVQCNVAGRDLRSVVEEIRARAAAEVPLPPGYFLEYGGQFESAESTQRTLLILGAVILAGMAFLLYAALHSASDAMLVMLNLPLALVGGVFGVALSGGVLSVASMIGFITVFGIAARNGILMVTHVRHLQREEGVHDLATAIERGARERLAPILMTALAAGLALLPLALRGDEPGTEILTPMAIVILCGLLTSTFLNLLVMPAMLMRFGGRGGGVLMLAAVASCGTVDPAPDLARTADLISQATDVQVEQATTEDFALQLHDGLTLKEAQRACLLLEPGLQARFTEVGIARADLEQAGLLRNPALSLLFLFPSDGASANVQVSLMQSVSDFWNRPLRQDAASFDLDATVYEVSRAAAAAIQRVRTAYSDLLMARGLRELTAAESELAVQVVEASRKEAAAGALPVSVESAARAQLARARDAQTQAELAVHAAARDLALAIGWKGDMSEVELTDKAGDGAEEPPDLIFALERAREMRLDLRAAAAARLAVETRARLAGRAAWLDLSVGAAAERPEGGGASLLGPAFGFDLPLFDRNQYGQAKAALEIERARWEEERISVLVEQEVREAVARNAVQYRLLRSLEDVVLPDALARLARLESAVIAGDLGWRETIEARLEVVRTRRALVLAQGELAAARADLAAAMASPWSAQP